MTPRSNWMVPREIESPGDLADVIRTVASAVRDDDLRQITPGTAPFGRVIDIRQIAPEGPWPDYLELLFEDARTGKRFRLVAETYHGAGGLWEIADEPQT